jgi:hypothetical protein
MSIRSINGVTAGNIATLNGVSYSLVSTYNGVVSSLATLSFVTTSLMDYWDPADIGSRFVISGVSASRNLSSNYTSSVYATNGSSSLGLAGTIFTTFTSGSVSTDVYYFDGVNDYAQITPINTAAAEPGNPRVVTNLKVFTLEMWLRSSGSWINNCNWVSMAGNTGTRARANNTSGQIWIYSPNVALATTPGGTISTNDWNHFVLTMADVNATNDRLTGYVNGTQVFQDTTGNYAPNYNFSQVMYGSFFGSSEFQRMYMGEVRRYNIELTSAEVLTNFSSSRARYGR